MPNDKSKFQSFISMALGSSQDQSMNQEKNGMGSGKSLIFCASNENFLHNGSLVLEESISLFHGKAKPFRCFSAAELNTMVIEGDSHVFVDGFSKWYKGVWDGRPVILRSHDRIKSYGCGVECIVREIVVGAQMGTHNNVHKLLGCCLETDLPVLVYEWVGVETLADRILSSENQNRPPLVWKERLRIAWEVSHAVAYLHTAFPRPIVHKDLKPAIVFLDRDDVARLSDFSLSVSIPEGKQHVQLDKLIGCFAYLPPEYRMEGRVSVSADVYAFGVLFLVTLTGKGAVFSLAGDGDSKKKLVKWVTECLRDNKCITEIVDPSIIADQVTTSEHLKLQLRASVQLALKCTAQDEDNRPTMVDVATELQNLIRSSETNP